MVYKIKLHISQSSNLVEDEIKRQFKSAVSREDNFETCMTENNVTFGNYRYNNTHYILQNCLTAHYLRFFEQF